MRGLRRLVTTAALATAAAAVPAGAQEGAPALFAAVAARIDARAELGQRWAFTRTFTLGDESFTARYDPSRSEENAWTLIAPASLDDLSETLKTAFNGMTAEDDADLGVVMGAEEPTDGDPGIGEIAASLGDAAHLANSNGEESLFTFAAEEGPKLFGMGGMARHPSGEVRILIAEPMVASLRYYAEHDFKPNVAARITTLDFTQRYGETEPGGPIAIVAIENSASGRALFRSFDQSVTIANSDFARVDAP